MNETSCQGIPSCLPRPHGVGLELHIRASGSVRMTLEILLQPLVYGLQIGLTYVLLALGLTVIFSIVNVLNLAHCEF